MKIYVYRIRIPSNPFQGCFCVLCDFGDEEVPCTDNALISSNLPNLTGGMSPLSPGASAKSIPDCIADVAP